MTSYEIAMRDIKFLSRHKLKYLIVDEGHRLKNFESKLFRELKLLNLENKLLLTGVCQGINTYDIGYTYLLCTGLMGDSVSMDQRSALCPGPCCLKRLSPILHAEAASGVKRDLHKY